MGVAEYLLKCETDWWDLQRLGQELDRSMNSFRSGNTADPFSITHQFVDVGLMPISKTSIVTGTRTRKYFEACS